MVTVRLPNMGAGYRIGGEIRSRARCYCRIFERGQGGKGVAADVSAEMETRKNSPLDQLLAGETTGPLGGSRSNRGRAGTAPPKQLRRRRFCRSKGKNPRAKRRGRHRFDTRFFRQWGAMELSSPPNFSPRDAREPRTSPRVLARIGRKSFPCTLVAGRRPQDRVQGPSSRLRAGWPSSTISTARLRPELGDLLRISG